jgi:hypothetical protein
MARMKKSGVTQLPADEVRRVHLDMSDDIDGDAEPSGKTYEKKKMKRKAGPGKGPLPRPPAAVSRSAVPDGGEKKRRRLL